MREKDDYIPLGQQPEKQTILITLTNIINKKNISPKELCDTFSKCMEKDEKETINALLELKKDKTEPYFYFFTEWIAQNKPKLLKDLIPLISKTFGEETLNQLALLKNEALAKECNAFLKQKQKENENLLNNYNKKETHKNIKKYAITKEERVKIEPKTFKEAMQEALNLKESKTETHITNHIEERDSDSGEMKHSFDEDGGYY